MRAVIIGNSAAGLNALESFRKYDLQSSVDIISMEKGLPYSRVLLPYYLRNKLSYEKLFIRTNDYYETMSAKYIEDTALVLNEEKKCVELKSGKTVKFDRILIASGSLPIKPPIQGLNGPGVYHMWTLNDSASIEPYLKPGKRVLILGSGFVSMQAAWATVRRGLNVSLYELCPRLMPRVLDNDGAELLQRKILQEEINLKLGVVTEKILRTSENTLLVYAKNEEPIEVDLIIVGTGVKPNISFLQNSFIKVDRGILVNKYMETNLPCVYAAGDVAQGPIYFGERQDIHALWPTAVEQGKIAGANMAGNRVAYGGSLNMNVTELFGTTVASLGCFEKNDSNNVIEYWDKQSDNYLKVVFENDVPIGAVSIGNSTNVALLGILRPFIRQRRKLVFSSHNIMKELHLKIAGRGNIKCVL